MDIEKLKSDLKSIGYGNLTVNDGNNQEYFGKVKVCGNFSTTKEMIAFIDFDSEEKDAANGIAITETGLNWYGSKHSFSVDEKFKKTGNIEFLELRNWKIEKIGFDFATITVELKGLDIRQKNFELKFGLAFNSNLNSEQKEQEIGKCKEVFETLLTFAKENNLSQENIPDVSNAELVDAFTGDDIFYKKIFSKYNINGIDRFAFAFNTNAIYFHPLCWLLYRKLYLTTVIVLVLFFTCLLISIGLGIFVYIMIMLLCTIGLPPYLLYKKFKRTLAKCTAQNMTFEQKKDTLAKLGGTNTIAAIASFAFLIIMVICVFNSLG